MLVTESYFALFAIFLSSIDASTSVGVVYSHTLVAPDILSIDEPLDIVLVVGEAFELGFKFHIFFFQTLNLIFQRVDLQEKFSSHSVNSITKFLRPQYLIGEYSSVSDEVVFEFEYTDAVRFAYGLVR